MSEGFWAQTRVIELGRGRRVIKEKDFMWFEWIFMDGEGFSGVRLMEGWRVGMEE
jgi:hypothetical protein